MIILSLASLFPLSITHKAPTKKNKILNSTLIKVAYRFDCMHAYKEYYLPTTPWCWFFHPDLG